MDNAKMDNTKMDNVITDKIEPIIVYKGDIEFKEYVEKHKIQYNKSHIISDWNLYILDSDKKRILDYFTEGSIITTMLLRKGFIVIGKTPRWRAKFGEPYYYLTEYFRIMRVYDNYDSMSEIRYNAKNYFENEECANRFLNYINSYHENIEI